MNRCPVPYVLFVGSMFLVTLYMRSDSCKKPKDGNNSTGSSSGSSGSSTSLPPCKVVFILGGPGTGKGTQCQLLVKRMMNWVHLSAGDLLRSERSKSNSQLAEIINYHINSGQIVPASITVQLLEQAMMEAYEKNPKAKFLIDGFPRSQGNVDAWQDRMSHHDVLFCVNFTCPEEILVGRLLERGRGDDSIETIRKRFQTHETQVAPIVESYEQNGKLKTVMSDKPVEDVYEEVRLIFRDII